MRGPARGTATVVAIILLALLQVAVAGMVVGGARDQDLTARRFDTLRAFYAAESGVNMALREVIQNADIDGDGTVGSISDDGSDLTDPAIGSADVRVRVADSVSGLITTLTSTGRAGTARREIDAIVQ